MRERWLECMQSDRLIAAIKSQKYLEMFSKPNYKSLFCKRETIHGDLSFVLFSEGKKAVEQGMKLRVYTVNDAKVVPMLRNAGVSALMTDFPNEILTEKCQS
ncbi:glycerophosphodiester phosphodiesterase family protein [Parageobacillus toebii]|uniref:glycerophosphodiester phosphodiesterase family protein n=1 Tax=Parageobacillus toebii TaxID=153151 RepID=UPI00281518AF|nr:glycerophosphodiester phosphodiesterase family protein [Parageobacillus toebii]WMT18177.1 glycerophosphodiester phosphodiesterase family protein [Parageobacillus toebii]